MLYGERGVGKTSLANVLAAFLGGAGDDVLAPRINCETADTFETVWKKALARIASVHEKSRVGFRAGADKVRVDAGDLLKPDEPVTTDVIRRVLSQVGEGIALILIIDEFDRLTTPVRAAFADLIKTLSDQAVEATVLMVGVADNVDDLIDSHHSVARALAQIHLPRMNAREIERIINDGLARIGMTMELDAKARIVLLSQGLPHYTHLITLHAVRVAIDAQTLAITDAIVAEAIRKALEDAHQTIRTAYTEATYSARKDNLFADVLLACALAETDDSGYFAAQDVRGPLQAITGTPYQIPTFSQHLNDFSSATRANTLVKEGSPRRYRYRFSDPLMQPYVVMLGLANNRVPASLIASE
jgi:Cdc6-like AAA superfamily ATPase